MVTGAQSNSPAVAATVGEKKKLAHIGVDNFAPGDIGELHLGRQLHFPTLSAPVTILSQVENQSLRNTLVESPITKIARDGR